MAKKTPKPTITATNAAELVDECRKHEGIENPNQGKAKGMSLTNQQRIAADPDSPSIRTISRLLNVLGWDLVGLIAKRRK